MSDNLLAMMEQDTAQSSVENLDQDSLSSVAGLARAIRDKEALIEDLENRLKDQKKQLLKLTDEDLPTMLAEMGLSSFTLDDGSNVQVKQTYGASIAVDNRPAAYDWLRDKGYDDIIKNTVSCQFASQQGYYAEQKTEIHPQTLRAFVKERVEKGDDFPMELFGAWIGQRAVIKRSK